MTSETTESVLRIDDLGPEVEVKPETPEMWVNHLIKYHNHCKISQIDDETLAYCENLLATPAEGGA